MRSGANSLILLVILTTLVCGTSFGDACKDLSDQICNCEPTEALQQACLRRVDAEAKLAAGAITEGELLSCTAIIDAGNCTCDSLADGDFQACGLAEPTG